MHVSDQFVDDLFANNHFNTLLTQFHSSKVPLPDYEPSQ